MQQKNRTIEHPYNILLPESASTNQISIDRSAIYLLTVQIKVEYRSI